ncbi:hypothetical protein QAD02_008969 [Eretmocerus hayati]|uniref:Uncharacterized protein n=1 Tax=Eretmocerus hayati TaxID=131215 RepID=A0ACC2N837_9HYME|nr:hypothetical protein QAD02_008969 [Eretmocerus hayati]
MNGIDSELTTHHKFNSNRIEKTEASMNAILDYMKERQIDPFMRGSHALKDITTEELTDPLKEQNKSLLIRELEKNITMGDLDGNNTAKTTLVIDIMLAMRQINEKGLKTFGDMAKTSCDKILQKTQMQKVVRIDFIFDSYFEESPKHSKHMRREKEACVLYRKIDGSLSLPKGEGKFSGSSENTIFLQKFLRSFIQNREELSIFELIFSSMNDLPCSSNDGNSQIDSLECPHIGVADVKIFLHMNHAVSRDSKNVYLLSSDTDVTVLALYFFENFRQDDLEVGTKSKALQENPQHHFLRFAKDDSTICIGESLVQAEEYLMNIFQKSSICTSFAELRLWTYYHAKESLIEDLPPTSKSIRLHILRTFYIVYTQTQCLNSNARKLNPLKFGYTKVDNFIMPEKVKILIPPANEVYSCLSQDGNEMSAQLVSENAHDTGEDSEMESVSVITESLNSTPRPTPCSTPNSTDRSSSSVTASIANTPTMQQFTVQPETSSAPAAMQIPFTSNIFQSHDKETPAGSYKKRSAGKKAKVVTAMNEALTVLKEIAKEPEELVRPVDAADHQAQFMADRLRKIDDAVPAKRRKIF